jgi:hypothetical protein
MRSRLLLIPLVASAALLAGCNVLTPGPAPSPTPADNGVRQLAAAEILGAAQDSLGDAESVRMSGTYTVLGVEAAVDLGFVGDDMEGTANVYGVGVEVVKIGAEVYVHAALELFAGFLPPEQAQQLADMTDKWFKVDVGLISAVVPVPMSSDDLLDLLKPDGELVKGEPTMVNGEPAIVITDAEGGELYVATEGEPYPLKIVSENLSIEFEYDEEIEIEAPPAEDIVDLGEMFNLS